MFPVKLWLVLTLTGTVGGTWGPLPYGAQECQRRIADLSNDLNHSFEQGMITKYDRKDIKFFCLEANKRPALGEKLPLAPQIPLRPQWTAPTPAQEKSPQ